MTMQSSEGLRGAQADRAYLGEGQRRRGWRFWGLPIGSIGVVFGDIGTSPLYAMREALAHAKGISTEDAAMGVVSLVFWALMLIVTVKYLIVVMRADNKG